MGGYEHVMMDKARKIYVPASLEEEFRDKTYMIIPLPDGDVILHQVRQSKNPLKELRALFKNEKRSVKEIKKEILKAALDSVG